MLTLRLKQRIVSASWIQQAPIACAAAIAMLLTVLCGSLHATAETPVLNTSGPSTFRGEIAKGLKIEMRLYQDGSSLYGTYSYEAYGRDIQVKGKINERGEFTLQEFVKGKVTGNFKGKFVTMDKVEGRWFKKSPRDTGRSFYVIRTGTPLAATQVSATAKPSNGDRETAQTAKEVRPALKAEATGKAAPATAEAHPQTLPSVKQPSAAVTREMPIAQQESKIEARPQPQTLPSAKQLSVAATREVPIAAQQESKIEARPQPTGRVSASQQPRMKIEPPQPPPVEQPALRAVVAEESPKAPARIEAEPVEKPSVEGKVANPEKKKKAPPWAALLNPKVAGGVGGLLLLCGGLAWLTIVAGGAAGFRENSPFLGKVHAAGLAFLPGVLLLALGVGAVLAVFVE